jgi:ATP-dependent exoDNAse (exonuclease V) alpha subunit
MILSNDLELDMNRQRQMTYANGDLGELVEWLPKEKKFVIRLKRNGAEVKIGKITRTHEMLELPFGLKEPDHTAKTPDQGRKERKPFRAERDRRRWVVGEVQFFPFRLAFASTIHKSQGLTLDAVQLDMRAGFTGEASMMYVGLSRCRTPEGLMLVGAPAKLAERIRIHDKARPWI